MREAREVRALRRRLAETRVEAAMALVEEAQNILDHAARNLCSVAGGGAKHAKVSKLSERCRAMWGELERFHSRPGYHLDGAAEGLADRGEVER